jgi:hypothetical protein
MRSALLAIAVAGCRIAAADPDCDSALAPPPGADRLCDEHVMAKDSEIHWTSFATTAARSDVDARYGKLVGTCGITGKVKPDLDLARGDQHLATFDATSHVYPTCGTAAKSGARTVIVISTLMHR